MAMRRKSFSTKKAGTDDVIVLAINDVEFRCTSKIPGVVLIDFISTMDMDDPKSAGQGITKFLQTAIVEEDWILFDAYIREPENDVDLDLLGEACGWLAEQYTGGNPTEQSPSSSSGSENIGPTPSATVSEPALTSVS